MKIIAFILLMAGSAYAQTVIEAPSSRKITEDEARGRCVTAINLAGKRPVEATLPKAAARAVDNDYLFRWKTSSGYMNCQISIDKRGKMKVFNTTE